MKKYTFLIIPLLPVGIILCILLLIHGSNFAIWNPQGLIATQERNIIFFSIAFMMILALPAIFLTFFMAWKYQDAHAKTAHDPHPKNSQLLQLIFWGILSLFALVLAVFTWGATHRLDPYKSLASSVKPITIQVVALRWKWLFIYPEYNIATVNVMHLPVNTPIHFELTADDAPMNSFWIPQLSGQIYAMTGMKTQLHILASTVGDYTGSAAEISGQGFADMRFPTTVSTTANFDAWVLSVKNSHNPLDTHSYASLIKPSENTPHIMYSSVEKDLYNGIVTKYMMPKVN